MGTISQAVFLLLEFFNSFLDRALKKYGRVNPVPLTNFMAMLEKMDATDALVPLAKIKAALERVLGKKDHPVIAALNAQLGKEKKAL